MSQHRIVTGLMLLLIVIACRETPRSAVDSTRTSLPPIFARAPAGAVSWRADAGALLVVSAGNTEDSAQIVLPDVTDSTIASLHGVRPDLAGVVIDLFGRSGRIASGETFTVLSAVDSSDACFTWPAARLRSPRSGWSIGFAAGHVAAIPLDSIEAMSSVDSAALAAVITQIASTLPATSDPTYRGLPFRVRSAYTFVFDSTTGVVADVMRSVNEEATPRLEHLLLIGEKAVSVPGKYRVVYFNRTAGTEEATQVTELLAMITIGNSRLPVAVISVEYGDGGRYGLLARDSAAQWRTTWKSAYTGC